MSVPVLEAVIHERGRSDCGCLSARKWERRGRTYYQLTAFSLSRIPSPRPIFNDCLPNLVSAQTPTLQLSVQLRIAQVDGGIQSG